MDVRLFARWIVEIWPEASVWSVAANVATTCGVVLAIVSAFIALAAYTRSASDSANNHMHGIFREYLRLRYDFETYLREHNLKADDEGIKNLRFDVVASRLYAAEEMWAWVRARDRWWLRMISRRHRDNHRAWLATVVSHVVGEEPPEITSQVLSNYIRCYSVGFLRFVTPYVNVETLDNAVAQHWECYQRGRPRPAGLLEPPLTVDAVGPSPFKIKGQWPPVTCPPTAMASTTVVEDIPAPSGWDRTDSK